MINLFSAGKVAARSTAAHVDVMHYGCCNGDAFTVDKQRLKHDKVRQMLPATVGVIGEHHIAIIPLVERNMILHDILKAH